jgi:hypothetical protein
MKKYVQPDSHVGCHEVYITSVRIASVWYALRTAPLNQRTGILVLASVRTRCPTPLLAVCCT